MELGETDNLDVSGTESANPSESDTSADWDYYDPDDDQDTVEATDEAGTDDEAEAANEAESETAEDDQEQDGQSEDEPAAEESEGEDEEPAATVSDDVKVTMGDGSEVTLQDLKQGYLRQSDYTRKTTDLVNQRQEVAAQAERISRTVDTLTNFLVDQIPPAPDPSLAYTDSVTFVQQKAAHDAAMDTISKVLGQADEPKQVAQELSENDRMEVLRTEGQKLAASFPDIVKPEFKKQFFDSGMSAARDLGFSETDIKGVTDSRIHILAFWAKKGMDADKARKEAKKKVVNVPPVAKPKRQKAAATSGNKDAMRRLKKSNSLDDAMSIDFD